MPRPRTHLLTYHGVLAPAAQMRDLIVPAEREPAGVSHPTHPADAVGTGRITAQRARTHRSTWAELLRRVFAIDVLTCPHCGGARRLIATITQRSVVERILDHLGLPSAPPAMASARAPPELAFAE